MFCPSSPPPTRNDAIAKFVAWAKAHPEYDGDHPVNVVVKFLTETLPCP
ncbi:MAG TPA: hypothetical protein VFD92_26640 [Candidatus Binatia bacterium]|nr:hypothetical protein [Candidatus Binatia bacterium]